MSDEFNEPVPPDGGPDAPPPELTIDDLFNESIDEDAVKKAAGEMLLANGTYTTVPPFTPKIRKDKTGRTVVNFWGSIVLGENKGKIGLRLSSERRNKLDFETGEDTGKPDQAYRNYVQAKKAYEDATGEKARSVGDVVRFLADYPVKLRIIQTASQENMVVAISAVRPQP